jgi:hypothetical protein
MDRKIFRTAALLNLGQSMGMCSSQWNQLKRVRNAEVRASANRTACNSVRSTLTSGEKFRFALPAMTASNPQMKDGEKISSYDRNL